VMPPLQSRRHGKTPVILQIIPHLATGGAEQGCVDVAAGIVQAGGRAIVISNGGSKSRLHELKRAGAVHIDLPVDTKNIFTLLLNIHRLRKVIVEHQVDVVHVRSRAPAWSAFYACKYTGVPFMTTAHAPYNTQNKLKKWYNGIMARGVRVIAISNYVADYLRRTYDMGNDRLRLIHRGTAPEKFHPSAVTPDRMIKLSSEWRLPEGARVILLPGRLTRWKGQHILIKAMKHLKATDTFALLPGPDQGRTEYAAQLHKLIADYDLEGRVRIVGDCTDMPAAYMLAHVVVSASIEPEGFGRIPIEAQAMGRIVIGTNHGGACETIMDGVTGFLVPPGDDVVLAQAIERVLDMDDASRASMGIRAIEHIHTHFTRDHMVAQTIDVYNEILTSSS
jgi:glycosyltransferase involved in cell wall biosynthesis